jgi:Na+/H+-dicarboxylate symporter
MLAVMTSQDRKDDQLSSNKQEPKGGFGGLVAILVGIVIGALVGVFYGQSMWKAAGGPAKLLERLHDVKDQKEQHVAVLQGQAASAADPQEAAEKRTEADRLRGQVPKIDAEIARIAVFDQQAQADKQAGRDVLARTAWQLIRFCGDLFLQVLKLLVIPLVVTSMMCGVTSLGDVRKLGRIGGATIGYYMITTTIAVLIGIMLVQVIRPGKSADDTFSYKDSKMQAREGTGITDTLLRVVLGSEDDPGGGMFPVNIFQAASSTNVLALIMFALVFGGALTTLGAKGQVVIDFFVGANEAVMKMVHLVMLFAPVGIFGLVAGNIAKNGGGSEFGEQLGRLAWYVATVLTGLALHAIVLGGILALLTRRNPLTYTYNLLRALLTAMSTASSSATLPVTMECVEANNGVSNRSASFVLPLGATVNMDGTALYEAVAAIFIAQSMNIELGAGQLIVIFLTATLAAIGAAGIPEAGLVTMVLVLTAVGLPVEGIGTILAIDWFLDRLRTTVNVYGDAIGAGVIDRLVVETG